MCKQCKKDAASEMRSTLCIGGAIAIFATAVIAVKVVVAVRLIRCLKMRGGGISACDGSENEAKEESTPNNARYGRRKGDFYD